MRYHKGMRFRTGVIAGFAAGYYFGSRAGRERYEQLRKVLDAVPFGTLLEKTEAVAELALERVRHHDEGPDVMAHRSSVTGP
jgi:hypothetical protein